MPFDLQEHKVDTGAVTLNYAEGPSSGPPLVLLHGGSARWQGFRSIMPELAEEWHFYAPDFRGHGRSDWTPGRYRLQDYVDDVVAFLHGVVGHPVVLIGHSMGGAVALLVAGQMPELVRAVVVGDAPLDRKTWKADSEGHRHVVKAWRAVAGGRVPREEMADAIRELPVAVDDERGYAPLHEAIGEADREIEWLVFTLYCNDPAMLSAFIDDIDRTLAGYDMATVLPEIRCPVLLLQADPDAGGLMTDAEVADALPLLALPSHVRLQQISHVLHNERKEPVLRAILDFLRTIDHRL